MTSSKKSKDTSIEDRTQDVGESIGDLGAATADLGNEAKEQVVNLTEQVRQQATDQIASQKERAVDTLEAVALLLHQAGEQAELQDKTMLASYADKAAQQVGTLSESLAQQDVTQIVQTTKDFARREPMLFRWRRPGRRIPRCPLPAQLGAACERGIRRDTGRQLLHRHDARGGHD